MKTKTIFLILVLFASVSFAHAQFSGKKFEAKMGEMGTIKLEFKENTFSLYNSSSNVLVKGEYIVLENTITFVDKEGPISCQPGNKGIYKYTFENNQLILELTEDNCPGRKALAINPWKLLRE